MTRGSTQTREEYDIPSGEQVFAYADGYGSDNLNGVRTEKSGELAASTFSPLFPLPYLAAVAGDSDVAVTAIGSEEIDGEAVVHLRVRKLYGNKSVRRDLSDLSQRDLWLDKTTGLPVRMRYSRRVGVGPVPSIAIEVRYSDYRSVEGRQYPFHISKLVNGTPWAEITIQTVTFDSGLPAVDFTVR